MPLSRYNKKSRLFCALVAQLDRACASEAQGRAFESPRARQKTSVQTGHMSNENGRVNKICATRTVRPASYIGPMCASG